MDEETKQMEGLSYGVRDYHGLPDPTDLTGGSGKRAAESGSEKLEEDGEEESEAGSDADIEIPDIHCPFCDKTFGVIISNERV